MKKSIKALLVTSMTVVATFAMSAMVYAAPAKISGLAQKDDGRSSVEVEWEANLSAYKYEVQYSTSSTDWTSNASSSTTYSTNKSIGSLSSGSEYYVRVRGLDNKDVAGEWSDAIQVVTSPDGDTEIKQVSATTTTATIKWDPIKGATGYQIINGDDIVVAEVTGTTYTTKNNSQPYYIYAMKQSSTGYKAYNSIYSAYISKSNIKFIPKKAKGLRVSMYWNSLKEVKSEYDMDDSVDGAQFELYNNAGKKMKTYNTTYDYTYMKNVATNSFYKMRVRSYVTVNNQKKYGAWSDYVWFGQQFKPEFRRVSNSNLKISWNKVKGATSYEVYVSNSQKTGYKKVATTKKLSFNLKKFKNKKVNLDKKTYYVYVKAVKKVGKKKVKTNAEYCYYYL